MNRFQVLVSFLLLVSAIPLRANATTDPNIGLDDPTCVEACPPSVSGAIGTFFNFTADANGGGITMFTVSSPGFKTLDIETLGAFSVGCTSNEFDGCEVRNLDGVTDIYLEFPLGAGGFGFGPGDEFAVNLNMNALTCNPFVSNCSSTGPQGWNAGQLFYAFPNINKPTTALIPEPSTISLLGLGMLGLLAIKRKKFGDVLRST